MRLAGWPEHLMGVVRDWQDRPFEWGSADCLCFAAACVEAVTGEDKMTAPRGGYDDEESAKSALKTFGAGSLYHTLRREFGNPIPVAMARRGDLALTKTANGPTVFVVLGEKMTGPGEDGLEQTPTLTADRAFRVG